MAHYTANVIWERGDARFADNHYSLHQEAHEACFIANSIRTEVIVERREAV